MVTSVLDIIFFFVKVMINFITDPKKQKTGISGAVRAINSTMVLYCALVHYPQVFFYRFTNWR